MAEVREIPSGTYDVKLGSSFFERGEKSVYHTLRFDFKPKSLVGEKEAFIAVGGNGDVQVAVPGEGDVLTVFKGAQKQVKGEKECLLFFDHNTGEVRIEKLSSVMSVKKTRGNEDSAAAKLRAEIERLRKENERETDIEMDNTKSSSDSSMSSTESDKSDSESDSDDEKRVLPRMSNSSLRSSDDEAKSKSSDSGDNDDDDDDDDDDDLQEALEQQLRSESMPSLEETVSKQVKSYPSPLSAHSNSKKLLHDDLQLSESSDED